ncbi:unnamed protein product [Meganyctiphanes norvegica]|uniref:Cytochrome b5 heme-binding domain-containing protein n=1 Tax=Meganyctiphanes norvegica TaxID=48144 RepID=A0AAV2S3U4_MEGNR
MKYAYGRVPLYMLQPKAVVEIASQTLAFASQALGYRDPSVVTKVEKERQKDTESQLPIYTLAEVQNHDIMSDCWIILYDKVYDVTDFMMEHPGGEELLMEHAGRDATLSFRGVGHSAAAIQSLTEYLVGILPQEERIFSGDGPCQWATL